MKELDLLCLIKHNFGIHGIILGLIEPLRRCDVLQFFVQLVRQLDPLFHFQVLLETVFV